MADKTKVYGKLYIVQADAYIKRKRDTENMIFRSMAESLMENGVLTIYSEDNMDGTMVIGWKLKLPEGEKRQPAKAAILATDHDTPDGITYCVCPSCRIMIDYQDRYCRYCGQALSWETK